MNKVILIGNAGRDPIMNYSPSGTAVTKFSLAVSHRRKNKDTGTNEPETTWFNIIAFDRLAETCNQYIRKGSKIYVEGRLTLREYTDKDDNKRTAVEVIINEMELLDPKGARPADGSPGGSVTPSSGEVDGEDFPF